MRNGRQPAGKAGYQIYAPKTAIPGPSLLLPPDLFYASTVQGINRQPPPGLDVIQFMACHKTLFVESSLLW